MMQIATVYYVDLNNQRHTIGSKTTEKSGKMLAFHIKQKLMNLNIKFKSVIVSMNWKEYHHSITKNEVQQTTLPVRGIVNERVLQLS